MRGLLSIVATIATACTTESGPAPIETEGTLDAVFSQPLDTNMNVEPFAAIEAHAKFGKAGYCAGGLSPTCYEWKAFSFWGGDWNTGKTSRVLRGRMELGTLEPGITKMLNGGSAYTAVYVEDGYYDAAPWRARGWVAKSGSLTIVAVDGDLVTFTINDAVLEPSFIPPDDQTLGTFHLEATGVIEIKREEE